MVEIHQPASMFRYQMDFKGRNEQGSFIQEKEMYGT